MAILVYILCGLTSTGCAALLLKKYTAGRPPLLWGSLCFACLALANILLFVDLIILPQVDLSIVRHLVTLAGLAMMLYGLIWETK